MPSVISVESLGKKYLLSHQPGGEPYLALRDVLTDGVKKLGRGLSSRFGSAPRTARSSSEEFWALDDLSFEVEQGDRIGIIGRNGAGKSTLLKILSRITEPSAGCVRIRGRVASLLEVGTGFHPELSGRENIFLNGAILGMGREEIRRNFDRIVDFAEIEQFLDTPVKRYSSGMYVRLAFAVAAHLEPEILIVDEVLAVGDVQFQKKCLGKMEEVGRQGRTVLFVSHNAGAIHALTTKCLYLEKGKLAFYGDTPAALRRYLASNSSASGHARPDLTHYRPDYVVKTHGGEARIRYADIWLESRGGRTSVLDMGSPFTVCFELEVRSEVQGANLSLIILDADGRIATVLFSWDHGCSISASPGTVLVRLEIADLNLTPGSYNVMTGINQTAETTPWDAIYNLPLFEVENPGKIVHWLHRPWGSVHCEQVTWTLEHGATRTRSSDES
jgi:lipopolysaccharide transport system ATP-binding protein